MPFFQPSMTKSSSSSRARGGGDAGSLTPRCSATLIRCIHYGTWKKHMSQVARPHHNHHTGDISLKGNHLPQVVAQSCVAQAGGLVVDACSRRCRRHGMCPPPERATPQLALASRADGGRNGPCRVSAPPYSARRRQGPGERHEMHYKATFRKRLSPKGASQHLCLRLLAGSHGFCGMLWDIFPCLHSMFLCRRWWISCRTLSSSFVRSHLITRKCPRSSLSMSLCARPCAFRSWRMCRRSFPLVVDYGAAR